MARATERELSQSGNFPRNQEKRRVAPSLAVRLDLNLKKNKQTSIHAEKLPIKNIQAICYTSILMCFHAAIKIPIYIRTYFQKEAVIQGY